MKERIQQWRPFRYVFINLCGHRAQYTFTCPSCGSHNCEKLGDYDKDVFWSGHFRCSDCGEALENGKPLCYLSDAFVYSRLFPPTEQSFF